MISLVRPKVLSRRIANRQVYWFALICKAMTAYSARYQKRNDISVAHNVVQQIANIAGGVGFALMPAASEAFYSTLLNGYGSARLFGILI